jgi:transcriptional regulator with XRE-family HTH domain
VLKDLIRSKGVKQRFIAEKLGVSEVSVSNWVKGKTIPSDEHWSKLCQILDVQIDKLRNQVK